MNTKVNKLWYLFVMLLSLSVASCKTVVYPVDKVTTQYIARTDSVYVHDSIWLQIKEKQDTVFITTYKYRYREIIKTDTLVRCDSIPVITLVEVPIVTNQLLWWLKALMGLGIISILLIFLKIKI